jgi:hypothetical protein
MSETHIEKKYSKSLAKAVAAESLVCFSDLPALSDKDLADLKGILKGTKTTSVPIDAKQAITILAHGEPSVESIEILARILSNTSESTKVRVSAAANLGILGSESAEKALLKNLDTEDQFVRSEVIKSLGKVGSAESLRRLDLSAETASDSERRLIDFARVTIAFREGSYEEDSMPGVDWRTQSLKVVEGDRVAENVRKIWGSTYGVVLSREVGLAMVCGRSTLSVLLNSLLKRGSWLETIRSRPLIAGILTVKEHEVAQYSVRSLLITKPTDTGFTIAATRTDGDVVFAGDARPEGDGLRLTIRNVGPERTPVEIGGVITNDDIKLDLRTWRGTVRDKRHGEAL